MTSYSSFADTPEQARPRFVAGESARRDKPNFTVINPSQYSHTESHHIIKFKVPAVTPDKPKHNTRKQARAAVKKRLNKKDSESATSENVVISHSIEGHKSTSKLKEGRGRVIERSNSLVRKVQRSLSSRRSKGRSGDSVCSRASAKSTRSTKSLKSVGSKVVTKVKSFRRSRSVDGRSVASTSSRKSFFRRLRRKKKQRDGTGEKFVYVQQSESPNTGLKKKLRKNDDSGAFGLGMLCSSFETVTLCRDYICGNETDEELIGTVIGVDDNIKTRNDPNDPRY